METSKNIPPLKKIFSSSASPKNTPTSSTIPQNSNAIQQGETYNHWGLRICGIVSGSLHALMPCLQSAYNHLRHEQTQNEALQQRFKNDTNAQITQNKNNIANLELLQQQCNNKKAQLQESIEALQRERSDVKASKSKVNKPQRTNMIIGLCILIPLTIYLFIFYSSTFYSAFFREPDSMTNVTNAMFDPNALSHAYESGITNLLFVLLAPIIFLGLGYVLHIFSLQEGKMKYVKMAAILLVTFMFDCILAFKIGDQLHTVQGFINEEARNTIYTIGEAIKDINTWAVIFCGFIAYIIWGFVFDMTMSAYQKMDWNTTRLKDIAKAIDKHNDDMVTEENKIADLSKQITEIENKIATLTSELATNAFYDFNVIRGELANFYAGWVAQMKVLGASQSNMDSAQTIYDNMINEVNKKSNKQ